MRTNRTIGHLCLWICLAAIPIVTFGQETTPVDEVGGPLTGRALSDAPFTADPTTSFRGTLGDGTHLDLTTTARNYRDRMGRARVELMVTGFGEPRTMGERLMRAIVAPEPGSGRSSCWTRSTERRVTSHAFLLPRSLEARAALQYRTGEPDS